MPNVNIVVLAGNLTRDPELRNLDSGQAVANFGLAVNRKFKTSAGEAREEVMFVDCEAWGGTAENITRFFVKGAPIVLEGRLKLDQWETDSGDKRSKHKVVVDRWHFVDSKGDGQKAGAVVESKPNRTGGQSAAKVDEDDIPF